LHAGNGELILIVEDESEVREITKATLEAFGYRVLAAGNGQQALALYAAHQNEIQAVLTDVVMPVLDGVELAHSLSQLFPDARIIVTSGLPFTRHFSTESQLNISAFLSKPYSAEILLSTLAEVLTNTK
jgi:two-component system cell cycle sensor histidine kinase/response regulator CckA